MFETIWSLGIPPTRLLLKIMCRSESAVITNPNIQAKDENTKKAKDENKTSKLKNKIHISKQKNEKPNIQAQRWKNNYPSEHPGKSKNGNIEKGLFELDTNPETCDGQTSQNRHDKQKKYVSQVDYI